MAFMCCSASNPQQQTSSSQSIYRLGRPGYFARREIDCFPTKFHGLKFDDTAVLYSKMCSSLSQYPPTEYERADGGVFGLDFSPDGSILGAAMEKKSLLFFDPLSRKVIHSVKNAHNDCANSIRFLDSRLFVSCSDDNCAKLWDIRMLGGTGGKQQQPVRIFRGHTSWVKNVEYDSSNGILLTSGFDGFVFGWDINNFRENKESEYRRVFYTSGLMRMKFMPGVNKLVISTHWGYLLVLHNFDVHKCGEDLMNFKPNMFWIMLKTGAKFVDYDKMASSFSSDRNRVELIVDFPAQNEPDNITSITPHPHGWCILSRNTNHDDNSEYTCVHDVQLPAVDVSTNPITSVSTVPAFCLNADGQRTANEPRVLRTTTQSGRTIIAIDMFSGRTSTLTENAGTVATSRSQSESTIDNNNADLSVNENISVAAASNNRGPYFLNDNDRAIILPRSTAAQQRHQQRMVLILSNAGYADPIDGQQSGGSSSSSSNNAGFEDAEHLPKTYKRLIYYAEEPNVGRGFIKEQAFSSDGRLIASPFGYGVRFLTFDENFRELCDTITPDTYCKPKKLTEAGVNVGHRDNVLCARFSPTHTLLATGCLGGKIVFHQPLL